MDNAFRAVWFDLAPEEKAEHLSWLTEEHLPSVQSRPGVAWTALYERTISHTNEQGAEYGQFATHPDLGSGGSFLTLIGATSTDVFFGEKWTSGPHSSDSLLPEMKRQRETRECIFLEETRVNGPQPTTEIGPAPAIQLGSFNTRHFDDDLELGAFYRQNRLPNIARTPGCVRARKMVSASGWAKHAIFYEFTSLAARAEKFEADVELGAFPASLTESGKQYLWDGRHPVEILTFAPGSPTVATRIYPEVINS